MPDTDWNKIDFQDFINEHNIDLIIKNAPNILYSKKDKEHEAYNSFIALFLISGFMFIYVGISLFLVEVWFSIVAVIIVIAAGSIADVILFLNYIKSNVRIRPLECWVEVYKGKSQNGFDFFCFSYYQIFSGKSHQNKAKKVINKH